MAKKTNRVVTGQGELVYSQPTGDGIIVKCWKNKQGLMGQLSRCINVRGKEPDWRNWSYFLNQLPGLIRELEAFHEEMKKKRPDLLVRKNASATVNAL